MRLISLIVFDGPEGVEMRAKYAYAGDKRNPTQADVKREMRGLLDRARTILQNGDLDRAGLEGDNLREKRATISFVERTEPTKKGSTSE